MDKNIDLVSLPKKSLWRLSLPLVLFYIFNSLYSMFDMVWVSQISVEAFYALGISIPIVSLIFSFGDSIGRGTNSIMSRFIGSGDYENAYNSLIHGMIVANVIWVILVLCLLFAQGILFTIDKADSYILIFDYLVPIVVFAYIFILTNLFSGTLQAEGNSKLPTILIIGTNVINIILDPIFIFNLNLGIKGAAYATVVAACFSFIPLAYCYITGKTKIPMSTKYFKFHTYIFVEIIKVAFPNILGEGLYCFLASFINTILTMAMGPAGPILYSVTTKLRSLLIAPTKGFGAGLMSVTGHLFGAEKFDELNDMFKYVLKILFIITLIVMPIFFIFRESIFGLFSITGMETEIFWIAIGATVIMLVLPCSLICARMLDGFGKSPYGLMLSVIGVVFEICLISVLFSFLSDGRCVLIGLVAGEILISVLSYLYIRHLLNGFDRKYKGKTTVHRFHKHSKKASEGIEDKIDDVFEENSPKVASKLPLILAIIAMIIIALEIISIPIKMHNYRLLIGGIASLIIGAISIYLMEKLNKPRLSLVGFLGVSIVLLVFMGRYGYLPTLLFIVTGILLLYSTKTIKMIKKK